MKETLPNGVNPFEIQINKKIEKYQWLIGKVD